MFWCLNFNSAIHEEKKHEEIQRNPFSLLNVPLITDCFQLVLSWFVEHLSLHEFEQQHEKLITVYLHGHFDACAHKHPAHKSEIKTNTPSTEPINQSITHNICLVYNIFFYHFFFAYFILNVNLFKEDDSK